MRIADYEYDEIRELVAENEPLDLGSLTAKSRHPRDRVRNIVKDHPDLEIAEDGFPEIQLNESTEESDL